MKKYFLLSLLLFLLFSGFNPESHATEYKLEEDMSNNTVDVSVRVDLPPLSFEEEFLNIETLVESIDNSIPPGKEPEVETDWYEYALHEFFYFYSRHIEEEKNMDEGSDQPSSFEESFDPDVYFIHPESTLEEEYASFFTELEDEKVADEVYELEAEDIELGGVEFKDTEAFFDILDEGDVLPSDFIRNAHVIDDDPVQLRGQFKDKPLSIIEVEINSIPQRLTTTSDGQGNWAVSGTQSMEDGLHTLSVTAINPQNLLDRDSAPRQILYVVDQERAPPPKKAEPARVENAIVNRLGGGGLSPDAWESLQGKLLHQSPLEKPEKQKELFLYAYPPDLSPFYTRRKKPVLKLHIEAGEFETPFNLRLQGWYQDPSDSISKPLTLVYEYKKSEIVRIPLHIDENTAEGKYTFYFSAEKGQIKAETSVFFDLKKTQKNNRQKVSIAKKSLLVPALSEIQFPQLTRKASSHDISKKQSKKESSFGDKKPLEFFINDALASIPQHDFKQKILERKALETQDFQNIPRIVGRRAVLRGRTIKIPFARVKIEVQSFPRHLLQTFADQEGNWKVPLAFEMQEGFHTVRIEAEDMRARAEVIESTEQIIAYAHTEESMKPVFVKKNIDLLYEKLKNSVEKSEKPVIFLSVYPLEEDFFVDDIIPFTLRIEATHFPKSYPFRIQTKYFDPEGKRYMAPDIDLLYNGNFEVSVPFKITEKHLPGEYEIEFSIDAEGVIAAASTSITLMEYSLHELGEEITPVTSSTIALKGSPEQAIPKNTSIAQGPLESRRSHFFSIFVMALLGIILVRLFRKD